MKKILLVGKNSFIGSELFFNLPSDMIVDRIPHSSLDAVLNFKYDIIINFAIHPLYKTSSYLEENDIDIKIAKSFPDSHQIMISSRKVYGSSDDLLTYSEDSPYNPTDCYGWNKMTTEIEIARLKDNFTILRGSNIFGFEYQRKSYMGFLMNQLKDTGNIKIDVSPFTTKDFISVQDASKLINLVVEKGIKGTYNLSSGIGEVVGYTAEYLIRGYGRGDLISKSKERKDQFILNNEKLLNALDYNAEFNHEEAIEKLGRQLCKI